jgi:hypothetical protein
VTDEQAVSCAREHRGPYRSRTPLALQLAQGDQNRPLEAWRACRARPKQVEFAGTQSVFLPPLSREGTLASPPATVRSMSTPEISPAASAAPRRRLALHTRIFIGFGAGTAAGLLVNFISPPSPGSWSNWAIVNLTEPAGKIFLRLLLMTVVPLVVASLTLGVAGLGDVRRLGRVGLKTLALTLVVSSISVGTGLFLANAVRPGHRVPSEVREQLFRANKMKASEAVAGALGVDRLLDMCRTVPNVTGDLVLATVVARSEGADILREEPPPPTGAAPSWSGSAAFTPPSP